MKCVEVVADDALAVEVKVEEAAVVDDVVVALKKFSTLGSRSRLLF